MPASSFIRQFHNCFNILLYREKIRTVFFLDAIKEAYRRVKLVQNKVQGEGEEKEVRIRLIHFDIYELLG